MLIPVLLILLLLAEPILLIHELSENTLKNKLIGECCAARKYENEWNNNPCKYKLYHKYQYDQKYPRQVGDKNEYCILKGYLCDLLKS